MIYSPKNSDSQFNLRAIEEDVLRKLPPKKSLLAMQAPPFHFVLKALRKRDKNKVPQTSEGSHLFNLEKLYLPNLT